MNPEYIRRACAGSPDAIFGEVRGMLARERLPAQTLIKLIRTWRSRSSAREPLESYVEAALRRRSDGMSAWHFTQVREHPGRVVTRLNTNLGRFAWSARTWDVLALIEVQDPVDVSPIRQELLLPEASLALERAFARYHELEREMPFEWRRMVRGHWAATTLLPQDVELLGQAANAVSADALPSPPRGEDDPAWDALFNLLSAAKNMRGLLDGDFRFVDHDQHELDVYSHLERAAEA